MSTYTSIYYHVVFSTKDRIRFLTSDNEVKIFSYINGVLKNNNCKTILINGNIDHVHILMTLHPAKALSNVLRDLKSNSSSFIRSEINPEFVGWQIGYSAFTISESDRSKVEHYIANQKEHHKKVTFQEEIEKLLEEFNVIYNKEYLLD